MFFQQGVDIIASLDQELEAVGLPPVSCRVDRALARETDGSLCGDGDERSQGSTGGGRMGGKTATETLKNTEQDELIMLWFEIQSFLGPGQQNRQTEGSLCRFLEKTLQSCEMEKIDMCFYVVGLLRCRK